MKKNTDFGFLANLQRMLSPVWLYSSLATVSLVATTLLVSVKANAQTPSPINSNEINNYAQAVLAMEPARQQAFDEIKKLIGGKDIPKIVCNDPKSITTLPKKAQDIAVNYCNRSLQIVQENGLTYDQFNNITLELQNNGDLKNQIYRTLLRLQNARKNR